MKKFIPTILLLVVLAGMWAFAHSQNYFQEEAEPEKLMGTDVIDPAAITSFRIVSGGETTELTKQDNEWVMTTPEEYPVNSYAVDEWLDTVTNVDLASVVEENPTDLEKYGLSLDDQGIIITTEDGGTVEIALGNNLPTGSKVYAQLGAGQVVSIAETTASNLLLSPLQLMDTTPFEWDNDQLVSLEWESSDISWVLKRKDGEEGETAVWTLNGESVELTDADSLMNQLKTIATDQVLQKPKQGSTSVSFTLTTELEDGTTQVYQGLTDSTDEGIYYVKTNQDITLAYVISADSVDKVADKAKDLLNGTSDTEETDTTE
ncbi:DUF4340 domain-containing protein [Paenibacillus gallinarum]|uniref:DUF4340 domain-containing protein n=1 Tax=Paenibacillus gallinarum TaxID=2762232 RepID=A0ABR8T1X7_9BACL|nr:DUF4340 domain-containing protein [Paenibacillus gallinarum]MBD7969752.1 DUF4340 domain-containing protein [Paenibacillus gallinarum]